MSGKVVGLDGLADQQREGARLAAAGWRGVDIAEHLEVAPETVSRWRKKPEYIAAIEAILSEARSEVAGRMVELTDKALDVVEQTLEHPYDSALRLRAAVALLQLSGVARAMSCRSSQQTRGDQPRS
jgi:hypothetical protein